MHKHAIVPNGWQVRTSRNLLGVLLFFDMKGRDPDNVIVLQGQLDGLVEIDGACRGRVRLLSQRACWHEIEDDRRQHWSNRHDLFPYVEVGLCCSSGSCAKFIGALRRMAVSSNIPTQAQAMRWNASMNVR